MNNWAVNQARDHFPSTSDGKIPINVARQRCAQLLTLERLDCVKITLDFQGSQDSYFWSGYAAGRKDAADDIMKKNS